MTPARVDDRVIDGIEVRWVSDPPRSGTRVTAASPELRVVSDYLTRSTWRDLPSIIRHVAEEQDLDINGSGFSFDDDGVTLHDPLEELTLSPAAFHRVMLRFFLAIRAGVGHGDVPLDREGWWPEFLRRLDALQARLAD